MLFPIEIWLDLWKKWLLCAVSLISCIYLFTCIFFLWMSFVVLELVYSRIQQQDVISLIKLNWKCYDRVDSLWDLRLDLSHKMFTENVWVLILKNDNRGRCYGMIGIIFSMIMRWVSYNIRLLQPYHSRKQVATHQFK